MTQEDVSKKIGVGRSTYAKYETGENEPSYFMLEKISDLFGVSTDYLLGRSDDPENIRVIGRGKPNDDENLLTPEEEERLHRLLADPELGLAFRKGALAKNTNRRRLLMALELLASDDDEGWER